MANPCKDFNGASELPVRRDLKGKCLQPEKRDPATGEELDTTERLLALLQDAAEAKPKLDYIGKLLARKLGGRYEEGPLKTFESALRTTDLKHPGQPEYLCDLARGYILLESKNQILAAVEFIGSEGIKFVGQKSIDIVDISNSFADPGHDNLRNLNIKFPVPLTGSLYHTVEIQCIHKDALKPYQESHKVYKQAVECRTRLQKFEAKMARSESSEEIQGLAAQWQDTEAFRLDALKRRSEINSAVVRKCGLDDVRDALNALKTFDNSAPLRRNKVETFAAQPI